MRTFDRLLHSTLNTISSGGEVSDHFLSQLQDIGKEEAGVFLNQCDGAGCSLIAQATIYNNDHWIQFLLTQGVSLRSQSQSGDNFLRLFDALGSSNKGVGSLSNLLPWVNDQQWLDLCTEWNAPRYGGAEILSPLMKPDQWDFFVSFLKNNPGRHMVFMKILGFSFVSACLSEQSFHMIEDLHSQLAWPIHIIIEDRKTDIFSIMKGTSRYHPLSQVSAHPRWNKKFWTQGWFQQLSAQPKARVQLNDWEDGDESFLYFAIQTWNSPDFVQKLLELGCDIHRISQAHRTSLLDVLKNKFSGQTSSQDFADCLSVVAAWDDRQKISDVIEALPEREDNLQTTKNRKM